MSWTQKNGYWVQPLDAYEKACYILAQHGKEVGQEHWLVTVTAKISNTSEDDTIVLLRKAWKSLRLLRPDIATEVHGYEKQYCAVKDVKSLEAWCDDTFRVESARSANDLFSHKMGLPGSMALCYWIPASEEVVLVSPHWRWDIRGATSTLDKLLSQVKTPGSLPDTFSGSECDRLPLSMQHITESSSSMSQRERIPEQAYQWFGHPHSDGPGIGLAPINPKGNPGNTEIAEIQLSRKVTGQICERVRPLGITVTTAVHASIIVETARANPNSPKSHHNSACIFDLRPHFFSVIKDASIAPSLCMAALPFKTDADAKWEDLIGVIQPLYRSSWNPNETNMAAAYQMTLEHLGENIVQVWRASDQPEPALSSIGVIDQGFLKHRYGPITICDISYNVTNTFPSVANMCYTWDGKLRLRACYNEAFFARDFVEQWLSSVQQNLLQNLQIERSLCVE